MNSEEKNAFLFTVLAVVGLTMTITMFLIIEFSGPYWMGYGHRHKVEISTAPTEYPGAMPFAGLDCLTLLICGLGGAITSGKGISYVWNKSYAIRLPIRAFCYIVNWTWLLYVIFAVVSCDPMPRQL